MIPFLIILPFTTQLPAAPAAVIGEPVAPITRAARDVGTVKGIITYSGKPAKVGKITVSASKNVECSMHHGEMDLGERSLLAHKDGGLANVVVTIAVPGAELIVPEKPAIMDNRGCRFEPHVLVVPAGGEVLVTNSDKTSHNIHTSARKNSSVNHTVAAGTSLDLKFKRKEAIPVSCDIHPWMKGWIFVADTPFTAVTDELGAFQITGLPTGTYEASLWHETLGRKKVEVEISADGTTKVDWQLAPAKKKRGRGRG
jgi:plastocyanin